MAMIDFTMHHPFGHCRSWAAHEADAIFHDSPKRLGRLSALETTRPICRVHGLASDPLRWLRAHVLQNLFAECIGIAFTGLGNLLEIACLTSSAQSPVRRATQAISRPAPIPRARRLRVKFLAVQEWSDRHWQAYRLGKFDTTGFCCDSSIVDLEATARSAFLDERVAKRTDSDPGRGSIALARPVEGRTTNPLPACRAPLPRWEGNLGGASLCFRGLLPLADQEPSPRDPGPT